MCLLRHLWVFVFTFLAILCAPPRFHLLCPRTEAGSWAIRRIAYLNSSHLSIQGSLFRWYPSALCISSAISPANEVVQLGSIRRSYLQTNLTNNRFRLASASLFPLHRHLPKRDELRQSSSYLISLSMRVGHRLRYLRILRSCLDSMTTFQSCWEHALWFNGCAFWWTDVFSVLESCTS